MAKKLTRSGVAYDITVSPHKEVITYESGDVVEFTFSSDLYRRKFIEKRQKNKELISDSLSNRFNFTINVLDQITDINLYTKVEKRGFLIKINESETLCLNTIKLDGVTLTIEI